MKWLSELIAEISDQINAALVQLKRVETWIGIGMIAGFAVLTYTVAQFAFRTDTVLRFKHLTIGACRELTNGPIIFLFCGMIFFFLSAVATLGELQSYFDYRKRRAAFEARQSLTHGLIWGAVSIIIPVSALLFFNAYCR